MQYSAVHRFSSNIGLILEGKTNIRQELISDNDTDGPPVRVVLYYAAYA
jgi:hypothetical protein